MTHLLRAVCLWLLWLLTGAAYAQLPPPMRLGEPTDEDFAAQPVAGDTTAAVVLCDYGTAHYEDYSGVVHLVHERMVRLKILGPAGYRYAQVQVALYNRSSGNDHLSNLRGCTYLRQPDGSVRKILLDASNVYSEQVTYRHSMRRFALPGVQAGAVIEYAYTVAQANGGKLPDWNFQWNIPVRWSEYRVNIPRMFRYRLVYQGYLPLTRNDADEQATAQLMQNGFVTTVAAEAHRWVVRDAPALRPEPLQPALTDYRAHISCELVGVQWPGQPLRNLGTSWEQKCQELRTSEYFGQVLEHDGFLQEYVQPLQQFHRDLAERAVAVRDLVQQRVRCDGPPRWWTHTPLHRTWEQRQGSSADVNLLLVAALRQAGLRASPVLLNTSSREAQELAHLDYFDYVLVLVELPGTAADTTRQLLLDATEPLLPASVLPQRCVGRPGHTVPVEGSGRWLALPAATGSTRYQEVKMTLDAQGNLSSQVHEELSGYAAQDGRRRWARLGAKGVTAELLAQHPDWEVSDLRPVAADNLRQPLGLRYTLRQPAPGAPAGSELYVQPLAAFTDAHNPFVSTERRFPVDFGRQQQETIMLTLTLPPGYVAELPPPLSLALPDGGGRYLYSASSPALGTVQLVSRLTLDKLTYTPQEYHALRELYGQMLARQAHALVVKKQ